MKKGLERWLQALIRAAHRYSGMCQGEK